MNYQNNLPILNRGDKVPDDGWYHVVPMGEFKIRHANKVLLQVVDDRAVAAMVQRYQDAGSKLLVDFDHFSYDEGHKSEAAGWVVDVEARTDGLWAKIEWTDLGEPAIMNKRYRFVSPVWSSSACEDLGSNRIRPLCLESVGLTNQPNMKGMQPLSNRGGEDKLPISHRNKENKSMEQLLKQLGLSASASEESAMQALTVIQNRAKEADVLLNRAETAEADITALKKVGLETDADAFCAKYADHIENRDTVREQFILNRESTEKLFAGIKVTAKDLEEETTSLKNRKKKQPGGDDEAKQKTRAASIRNRATQIQHEETIPWSTAFGRAKAELA